MPANSWGRGQGVSGRVLREYNFFYVLSCPFTNTVLALNNLYSIYIFVLIYVHGFKRKTKFAGLHTIVYITPVFQFTYT